MLPGWAGFGWLVGWDGSLRYRPSHAYCLFKMHHRDAQLRRAGAGPYSASVHADFGGDGPPSPAQDPMDSDAHFFVTALNSDLPTRSRSVWQVLPLARIISFRASHAGHRTAVCVNLPRSRQELVTHSSAITVTPMPGQPEPSLAPHAASGSSHLETAVICATAGHFRTGAAAP